MTTRLPALVLLLLHALPALAASKPSPRTGAVRPVEEVIQAVEPPKPPSTGRSVVRVNATCQTYDFLHPWAKRSPYPRRGIGAVVAGGRVLVCAELVANHTYVELENADSSEKCPAVVELADYDCNLAVIKPQQPEFLKGAEPLPVENGASVGDTVEVVQLESNGAVAKTPATITTITVGSYPMDGIALLTYKVSAPLQYRENSFTLPILREGALAGMLMRYDARSQTAELVPAPVIRAFLSRADRQPYETVARAGVTFSATRDPQLRRYLGLDGQKGGVYVSAIIHGSAAEKAGLAKGDVLLEIGGHPIDADGNYEHPSYGRIPFSHLITTDSNPGDTLVLKVFRGGKLKELPIVVGPRDPNSVVSESYIIDRPPRYSILGGLVFQELSRPYLREWGSNWRRDAPSRLVYLDEYQEELPANRGKIVFLSSVLPSDATVGYEDLDNLVVTRINGREIKRLEDVAEAVKSPTGGAHRIEFDSDPRVIFVDAAQVAGAARHILDAYNIPSLEKL